jgi:D-lactate dehydrogenase (cytochrome)
MPPEDDALRPALAELAGLLGERLTTDPTARAEHATDASHHRPGLPDAVAHPRSTDEISRILAVCHRHRLPVIPFGAGSGVEGGVVARHGGLCLDLGGMNHILAVHADDGDCRVEAGVRRKQLNRHLQETGTGLHFPVDPGADATLGGMAATRASGTEAVGYGTMSDNVLGLTAVLADGRVIRTGTRARKSAAGYDLTHLLVGSEGTLAVITEVALRLEPLPAAVSAAVCPFPGVEAAVKCVQRIIGAGLHPARCELLDEVQMDAVNRYAGLDYEVQPTLFLEFHGSVEVVAAAVQAAGRIAGELGGGAFRWATEGDERDRLWQARHDGYYACLALRPGCAGYVTDVCVPVSRLATCIERARGELAHSDLIAPIFGHVGDGNFHVVMLFDPDNEAELEEARRIGERIIDHALALGGTCTGEHGIGVGKIDALRREFGQAVDVMADIKAALDPHGILNPGKVLGPQA